MPQAAQGSGYPFQSFVVFSTTLKLTTKGFTLLSLMQKPKADKKLSAFLILELSTLIASLLES